MLLLLLFVDTILYLLVEIRKDEMLLEIVVSRFMWWMEFRCIHLYLR